jgi:hypothetical protein
MAHAYCMLDKLGYTHTHTHTHTSTIGNTYCFSTAVIVAPVHPHVTL